MSLLSTNSHESAHIHAILDIVKKCCIEISILIRQGDSISGLSKDMHVTNKTGDEVKKLDLMANEILKEHLLECEYVYAIGSEEEPDLIQSEYADAKYLVCFDPLDGSSNIDVNITVGTIFAIYKYSSNREIKSGRDIVMAGYCLYGGSTQFIVSDSFSQQTKMYSLLRDEDFVLMEPNLNIPERGKIYSVNESNKHIFLDMRINILIKWLIKEGRTARWVGSLVADAHRTLIKGGFFAYPGNWNHPKGKLRLLYEVYPFAFIFDMAGGCSSAAKDDQCILDIPFPKDNIHLKTPAYLSSPEEMNMLKQIKL